MFPHVPLWHSHDVTRNSYSTGPGIYSSKPTRVRGHSLRTRAVYVAINPWQPCYNYYISHLIGYKSRTPYIHSNNRSDIATIILNRKRVAISSIDFTSESFACPFDPHCLGMCSWTAFPGNADVTTPVPWPLPEFERDLSLCPPSCASEPQLSMSSSRFAFASKEELSKLAEGITPANTTKATVWAINNFQQWLASRNSLHPSDPVPNDILQCTDPQLLNNHLYKYVIETRKLNGDLYPPTTIHQLLCSILRHMRNKNPSCPNFLDKKDCWYVWMHHKL